MQELITRPIDQLGRVVIPRKILKKMGWKVKEAFEDGTNLEFHVEGNTVIVRESVPTCHCCKANATTDFYGVKLCEEHLKLIAENADKLIQRIKA